MWYALTTEAAKKIAMLGETPKAVSRASGAIVGQTRPRCAATARLSRTPLKEVPMSRPEDTTALVPFEFNGHEFRATTAADGEPLFCARDVGACIGMSQPAISEAVSRLDSEDVHRVSVEPIPCKGAQEMVFVTKPGVFDILIGSRKPAARPFQRWISHEVLPEIERTGSYSLAPKDDALVFAEALQAAGRLLEASTVRAELAEAKIETDAPAVEWVDDLKAGDCLRSTSEAWKHLGLPAKLTRWWWDELDRVYFVNRPGEDRVWRSHWVPRLGVDVLSTRHGVTTSTPKWTGTGLEHLREWVRSTAPQIALSDEKSPGSPGLRRRA